MRLFLLAGEPSGDKLGAALMAGLKTLAQDVVFEGVGGPLTQAEGLESLFPMDDLSVMGIAEVLPKYPELRRRLHQAAEACLASKPDALITIDSPDFSLRLVKLVKEQVSVPTIHYVAPSVWAWRSGRAEKMARHIDHVLALLPFEPPYMRDVGMSCEFVGHPVVAEPVATSEEVQNFRESEGLDDAPIVLVLPGSRRAEVGRLVSVFGEALRPVVAAHPNARVVVPAAAAVASAVIEAVKNWPGDPIVLDPRGNSNADARKRAAFCSADVALAASGTVSLELAASDTPMVIAYDMNWLSWQVMSRMAKVDTVTLVNLIAGSKPVPEFLGPACQPAPIAAALTTLLSDENARSKQTMAMRQTMEALGKDGDAPGLRAARSVLAFLQARDAGEVS